MEFKITKFIKNNGQTITIEPESELIYTDVNNEVFHYNYLMSKPQSFKIYEIKRLNDNVLFQYGDRIRINEGDTHLNFVIRIINFQQNGTVNLCDTSGNSKGLLNAVHWTTPVINSQPIVNNTGDTSFFNSIQTLIESQNPQSIRLEGTLKKTVTNFGLQGFLVKFFTEWNEEKNTIYAESREVQCESGKRRSLGDIYMICKYYFPNCTLKEICKMLIVTLPNTITNGFRTSYCSTINKRVWYYDEDDDNGVFDKPKTDQFGNSYADYVNNLNN